ncbi:MAG TPA: ATP-dependent DNA helicase RecG [Jiangellaceae bacterium]
MADLAEKLSRHVGPSAARLLAAELDLYTVGDLLRHYPRRYVTRGEVTDLKTLRVGDDVTVAARVARTSLIRNRNRGGARLEVVVTDGTGTLTLTFFGKHPGSLAWRERELTEGRFGLFAGKVGEFRGKRQLTHPEYKLIGAANTDAAAKAYASEVIPVYPGTAKLKTWQIENCVEMVLDAVGSVPDPIPPQIRSAKALMTRDAALRAIHRPGSIEESERAKHRLRFEEAFVLQVELARRRANAEVFPAIARPGGAGGLLDALDEQLPFDLTPGQRKVGEQISADLSASHPMHRLLQGEVGSGKTVVALRAVAQVIDSGGQAALLAPTEVLALQHYRTIRALLGPLAEAGMLGGAENGTHVALVTGSMPASARKRALLAAASGEAGIVIGTHALLQENVQFADLGLVVVDEQHRFGVEQRAALSAKSPGVNRPHVLVMTATPIPRTLAMTIYGDLWVSTLAEVPAGRADVATHVVPTTERPDYVERMWQRVREEVGAAHRVFIVCPRIGEDDEPNGTEELSEGPGRITGVLELADQLRDGSLDGIEIGILHGRLSPEASDEAMRRFTTGATPVLVCTTVVEVGVDVVTASMMVIMDADRFGVSQLHQLRGRIGRGEIPGLCLLVTADPEGTVARQRLDEVARSRDGFKLSRVDLELRREGEVLGAHQSGAPSRYLRLLSVVRDENVILAAREAAEHVYAGDPEMTANPALAAALDELATDERADYLEKA